MTFFKINQFPNYLAISCLHVVKEKLMSHFSEEWINDWRLLLSTITKKVNLKLKIISMKIFHISYLF